MSGICSKHKDRDSNCDLCIVFDCKTIVDGIKMHIWYPDNGMKAFLRIPGKWTCKNCGLETGNITPENLEIYGPYAHGSPPRGK